MLRIGFLLVIAVLFVAVIKNHRKPIAIIVTSMQIAKILMVNILAIAKMDLKMLIQQILERLLREQNVKTLMSAYEAVPHVILTKNVKIR